MLSVNKWQAFVPSGLVHVWCACMVCVYGVRVICFLKNYCTLTSELSRPLTLSCAANFSASAAAKGAVRTR